MSVVYNIYSSGVKLTIAGNNGLVPFALHPYLWDAMRQIPKNKLINKLSDALSDGKMMKKTLYEVAAMWVMLKDPTVPKLAKAEVLGALVYLINPFDAIPDLLPMGLVDDIALLGLTWNLVQAYISEDHRTEAQRLVLDLLGRLNLSQEIPADGEVAGDAS